jgi:hypothetical protein
MDSAAITCSVCRQSAGRRAPAIFTRQSVGSAGCCSHQASGRGTKPRAATQYDKPRGIHRTPWKVTTNQHDLGKNLEIGSCSV